MRICLYMNNEDPPLKKYIEEKIHMIKEDFLIKLSKNDEIKIRNCKTNHEVDSICKRIINEAWD